MLQYFKAFVHLALLITVPSTALYPQFNTPIITIEVHDTAQACSQKDGLLSYDDVLNLIRLLSKPHLFAKIVFFGISKTDFFSHVPSHCLQKSASDLSKKIQFFQTKRVSKESIDALENGELEKTCTDADLEKINHFLATLKT